MRDPLAIFPRPAEKLAVAAWQAQSQALATSRPYREPPVLAPRVMLAIAGQLAPVAHPRLVLKALAMQMGLSLERNAIERVSFGATWAFANRIARGVVGKP